MRPSRADMLREFEPPLTQRRVDLDKLGVAFIECRCCSSPFLTRVREGP